MKKIIIAGGSGFIGQALTEHLGSQNFEVSILSRSPRATNEIEWDGKTLGNWAKSFEGAFAVINLSGKSINCRHNAKNKAAILKSRLDTTRILGQAIENCTIPPTAWLNASAAGIYSYFPDKALSEESSDYADDFIAEVVIAWEKEFYKSNTPDTKKIALRTTLILGKNGGAFIPLKSLSKFGLGGAQGNGKQMVSWMHIYDFVSAISFMLDNDSLKGPINLCAPEPTSNYRMMKALRKAVRMPLGIPQPAWLLKIGAMFIGTAPELILNGINIIPKQLLDAKFQFEYPTLERAFDDLV